MDVAPFVVNSVVLGSVDSAAVLDVSVVKAVEYSLVPSLLVVTTDEVVP